MHDFTYHRPSSLADASKALAGAGDAKIIAGGMTLVPTMKQRLASPSDLVDLAGIAELKGIKVEANTVTIGAMTRHADVAHSADVKKAIPALAALAGMIGDRQVRAMGTCGGSIANNDPAADYPAAALALNATITTNKGKYEADKFFKGMFETALKPGEIISAVSFQAPKRAAYMKFKNPSSRFPIFGAFAADSAARGPLAATSAWPPTFRRAAR